MAQMRLKDKNCLAVALCFKTNRRKCRRQVASPTGESDDYSESLESLWNLWYGSAIRSSFKTDRGTVPKIPSILIVYLHFSDRKFAI